MKKLLYLFLLFFFVFLPHPLQMILREVLIQSDIGNMAGSTGDVEVIGDGLKYATMVVSTLPIMCLYPFLQKYFVAGVTIGAVKG